VFVAFSKFVIKKACSLKIPIVMGEFFSSFSSSPLKQPFNAKPPLVSRHTQQFLDLNI